VVLESFRSDLDLCKAARAGDDDALLVVIARYRPIAELAARSSRIPGYDYEDLLSEATTAIMSAARVFDEGVASFGSYAKLCVRNRIASIVRASRCRPVMLQHVEQLNEADADCGPISRETLDPTAEAQFDQAHVGDLVDRLRAELTTTENEILTNLLARGGVIDDPEADKYWSEVAVEKGCFRTGIWRVINSIRIKAQGVILV